jgi:hypothetical protein
MKREVLPHAIDIFSHNRIFNELALAIDVSGKLAAHVYFFIERVEIDLVAIDVSLADHQGVLVVKELALGRTHAAAVGWGGLRRVLGGRKQRCRRDYHRSQQQNRGALEKERSHWVTPRKLIDTGAAGLLRSLA